MNKKRALRNVFSSLLSYGALLILSIVVSKYIIVGYGSETNGLLASVNQIFSYISLLEAGIGTATIRALYTPLGTKNDEEINDILASSKFYYRRSAIWYFACVVIVSIIWPFVIETSISYWTVFCLIFFHGIAGVITFCYTQTIVNYLVATGKNYINNNVHVLATLASSALKLLICMFGLNIVSVSISLVLVNILKCLVYRRHMRKLCPEFFSNRNTGKNALPQRNSFLVHEISGVIFYSTDTIIISVFCGLNEASVYAVYSLVVTSLRMIIGQVFNGTKYILGSAYSNDKQKYYTTHDWYNTIYICCVFIIYTVAFILLRPFVTLYTNGITDADYLAPYLPVLFILIELLSSCRITDNELIRVSLHASKTISRTVTEAAINLLFSLILVQYIGLYGVLIGTIVALLYRTNDIVLYVNHRILGRSAVYEYKLYCSNFLMFTLFACASRKYMISADNYFQLVMLALVVSLITAVAFISFNIALSPQIRELIKTKRRLHGISE